MPFLLRLAALLCGLIAAWPADAQLRGGLRLPSLPVNPQPVERLLPQVPLAPADLLSQRVTLVEQLLKREPRRLERDPRGNLVVKGEVVLASPSVAALDAAQAAGFRVAREQRMDALGLYVVVLQAPEGLDTAAALARVAPQAEADFNAVYLPAGTLEPGESKPLAMPASTQAAGALAGLVDGGVDSHHPALRATRVISHGCSGKPVPDAHGTAVASLLAGRAARFQGAAPGATLYAADIYCGSAANGSVDKVLQALSWMAEQRVPVVNLSIVGPPNRLLEHAVQAMASRGHLLVAAVGNDGPAAPPLYPAAYAQVVGVTGVDPRRRVLPEAAQGPQVSFAAPGSDLAAASLQEGHYTAVRGTSFAAPLVAGLLARGLRSPDPAAAAKALASLSAVAVDLGAPGRDPVFGEGLVGQDLRIEPAQARR